MRPIAYGENILLGKTKRDWEHDILPAFIRRRNMIKKAVGDIPEGKHNYPVPWREWSEKHQRWTYNSQAMWAKEFMQKQRVQEIDALDRELMISDDRYWGEENPLELPTYAEMHAILRKYTSIIEHINNTIVRVKINPMRRQQEWIREHRVNTAHYEPRKHLWMGIIPAGFVPAYTGKRITIGA